MVILLANTWSPHSGVLRSDAVPRYMAAFITQLLASLRQPRPSEATYPSRIRFLLRKKDHIHALQSSVAALLKSDAWEASIAENMADADAMNHVLDGVKVVLWVDDGKHAQLARDGQTLLHQAAECGVRSFVYRGQVQGKTRRSTDAAIALLNDYSITHSLPIAIIESQPLFVLPTIKNHRTDDLSFTISSADHITSHPTLLQLAQAEAALVVRCHNREKFDPSIARHYELCSRQIGEPRTSLGSTLSTVRATGGGRRATGRARSRAPEIHETLERLHEAWLSYYPTSKSKTSRNLFSFLTRMTSQSDIATTPNMVDVGGGIAVTKTLLVSSDSGYGSTPTLPRKYKRRYKDPVPPLPDASFDHDDASSMVQSVSVESPLDLVSSKRLPDIPALHVELEESTRAAL